MIKVLFYPATSAKDTSNYDLAICYYDALKNHPNIDIVFFEHDSKSLISHDFDIIICFGSLMHINFDYSFSIENEVLTDAFNFKNYLSIEINFIKLFSILDNNKYINGLYCTIIKDGKVLKFKQYKNGASKISVFLGQNISLQNNNSVVFDIDLYAFDYNMRLINV